MNDPVFQRSDIPAITLTPEEQRRLLAAAEKAEYFLGNQSAGNGLNHANGDILIARQLAELMDGLRAKMDGVEFLKRIFSK